MNKIKLIIEIDEETYNDIQSRDWKNGELVFSEEWKAIKNGIPLPKGHGRLIDADALEILYGLEYATKYGNKSAEQQAHSYDTMMMYEIADMIDNAPTIIEADKVESEDRYGIFIQANQSVSR